MGRPSLEKPFLTELLGHCKGFLFRFLKQYKKKRCLKEGPKKTTYHVLPNSLNIFIKKKAISVVEPITHSETPKNSQAVEWVRQFTEDRGTVGSQPNMERSAEDEFEELNSELHSLHPSYKEQSKTTKKVMKKAIKSVDIPLAPQQKKHAMRLYQNHANLFSSPQGWAHIAFLSILHVYLSS
ncbi:MAG: hypothetical protein KJ588_02260, partial [Gammaproteobacteria bacterium]|nr:hypothetical protein [Gammaproteobacteria bacterium]